MPWIQNSIRSVLFKNVALDLTIRHRIKVYFLFIYTYKERDENLELSLKNRVFEEYGIFIGLL